MQDSRAEYKNGSESLKRIDLQSVVEDVGKHWISILLLTAAAWMFAFVLLSSRQQTTYASSATVAVTNTNFVSNVDTYEMLGYAVDIANKFKSTLDSREFKDAVAADLGYSSFQGSLAVDTVEESSLVKITVRSGSPIASYMEVKSILKNYKTFEKNLISGTKMTVLEQPVIQEKPDISSGSMKKAVVAAIAVFAVIVGILIILSLRKSLKAVNNGSDAVDKIGTEFLGPIYRNRKFSAGQSPLITDPSANVKYTESIRKLAVRIAGKMTENSQKVLLVTSAEKGEESFTTAANIAIALAQQGYRTVLADMNSADSPMQGKKLITGADLEERLDFVERDRFSDSDKAKSLMESLRKDADFVIIGASPMSECLNAESLVSAADTSLLVIRRHYADASRITKAVKMLGGSKNILGCAVSDVLAYDNSVSVLECGRKLSGAGKKLVERPSQDAFEVDVFALLADFGKEIRRYMLVILAVMLVLGGASYLVAKKDGTVTSSAYATFTVEPAESIKYRVINQKNICYTLMGKMYTSILTSDAVKALTKEDLGIEAHNNIPASISASNVQTTNLMRLTVSSGDPEITAEVLEATLRNSATVAEAAMGRVTITVIDKTEPATTVVVGRSGRKAALLGLFAGLMLCLLALFIKLIIRDTVASENELTWLLGGECLGNIPWIKDKAKSVLIKSGTTEPSFAEAVREIRYRIETETQLTGAKVFTVTSAVENEGKTTTAINLALSLAEHSHTVLLVDADMRNPSVLKRLGMGQPEKDITDLQSGVSCDKILVTCADNENLKILPGGKTMDCPLRFWKNEEVRQAIRNLCREFDYVVIDTPQSSNLSDNMLLAELAENCLYVVRRDHAKLREICEGAEIFEESDCRFLGYVMRG